MTIHRQPHDSHLKRSNTGIKPGLPLDIGQIMLPYQEVLIAMDMACEQNPNDSQLDAQRCEARNYICGVMDLIKMEEEVFQHHLETLGYHEQEIVLQSRTDMKQFLYRRLAVENSASLNIIAKRCQNFSDIVQSCETGIHDYNVMLAPQKTSQRRLI